MRQLRLSIAIFINIITSYVSSRPLEKKETDKLDLILSPDNNIAHNRIIDY